MERDRRPRRRGPARLTSPVDGECRLIRRSSGRRSLRWIGEPPGTGGRSGRAGLRLARAVRRRSASARDGGRAALAPARSLHRPCRGAVDSRPSGRRARRRHGRLRDARGCNRPGREPAPRPPSRLRRPPLVDRGRPDRVRHAVHRSAGDGRDSSRARGVLARAACMADATRYAREPSAGALAASVSLLASPAGGRHRRAGLTGTTVRSHPSRTRHEEGDGLDGRRASDSPWSIEDIARSPGRLARRRRQHTLVHGLRPARGPRPGRCSALHAGLRRLEAGHGLGDSRRRPTSAAG